MTTSSEVLQEFLTRSPKSGVYLLGLDNSAEQIMQAATDAGMLGFALDGNRIRNMQQFLRYAPAALNLPEACESSLQAFRSCLDTAADTPDAPGWLLLFDQYQYFFEGDRQNFGSLLLALRATARAWQRQGKPVYVLLRSPDTLETVEGLRFFAPSSLIWLTGIGVIIVATMLLLLFILTQLGALLTSLQGG